MPPKYYSKAKRNYSYSNTNDINKKDNHITITFLLIGDSKIGIDIPYKAINNDQQIKSIIKNNFGKWDSQQRIWTIQGIKNYYKILDLMLEHCKKKQYFCNKIPSYVFDTLLNIPQELIIKIGKIQNPPSIKYISTQIYMDPQTLPFYQKLYDFQKQSLLFGIQHHGRILLADEMGVGKTIQSLAISFMYRYQWPMVIICPSTLRYNWNNQILNWYGEHIKKNQIQIYTKGGSLLKDTTKILIISYDLAWKFKQIWSDFKIVIVDQAHYLKNSGCKRTDILVPQLARKKRIILLTGTPAFARPRQIYNLISIIRPDIFYNFLQFGQRYCQPTRNIWSGQIQYNGCKNSKQLFYILKNKIMLRRLKKDVLTQLPDKQRQKIIIQTNKIITKQINKLVQQNNNNINNGQDMIMQMFGLKNYSNNNNNYNNNMDYQKKRQSLMQAYRLSGQAKVQGVIQYILQLLGNDVKLLIFAHHRKILDKIQIQLNNKKYKSIRIDGEVEMAQRQNRVDQFQNNKNIMAALLSISAAGVGLTLTASSTVIFAQLHWTPAMMLQAQDRAHRIGQKSCVNCHYLIGQGTLDNILYNYLLKKINNVSSFVDGAQKSLEIQQLSKGEIGKISKSAIQKQKSNQKNIQQRQKRNSGKYVITPIRKSKQINQLNINIDLDFDKNNKNKNNNNKQIQTDSDIQSQLTNNVFKSQQNSNHNKKNNNENQNKNNSILLNNIIINKLKLRQQNKQQKQKEQNNFNNHNNYNNNNNNNINYLNKNTNYIENTKNYENQNDQNDQQQTLSIQKQSAKKLRALQLLQQQLSQNQLKNHNKIININKLKLYTNNTISVSQSKQSQQRDSIGTSQLLQLLQFDQSLRKSKNLEKNKQKQKQKSGSTKLQNKKAMQNLYSNNHKKQNKRTSQQYINQHRTQSEHQKYNTKKNNLKNKKQQQKQQNSDTDIQETPTQ